MKGWTRQGALAALLILMAAPVAAAKGDRTLDAALRDHIAVLASDDFGGREPGTPGETKTLRYLVGQWHDIGLVSGTNDPGHPWFAPVELVERKPSESSASFKRGERHLLLPKAGAMVLTSEQRNLVRDAPLLFVGQAVTLPPRSELAGRVAVMLDSLPQGADRGAAADRQWQLLSAGAAAVITILDGERGLDDIAMHRARAGYALAQDETVADLEAYVSRDYAAKLIGREFAGLLAAAARPDFTPRPLGITGTLEATSSGQRITTSNLIAKLPGKRPQRGAVLLVAHWDHFGTCASPPAEDLICNGAIDNASGLAVMIEVARSLARGKALERDVYFVATTGEELGLLGARAFAANPPLPLEQIVAAFNIDSPALARSGDPLSIVGRGRTPLDAGIARVAKSLKRKLQPSAVADDFLKRQDAWALVEHDIPAVMVSAAYADAARVARFMEMTYHRPSDELTPEFDLRGAVGEAALQTALVRWFASTKNYPANPR
ncbi:MAG: M20/M25/M40 family metallo-hydrolase [Novosphingobium sp.]